MISVAAGRKPDQETKVSVWNEYFRNFRQITGFRAVVQDK